LGILFSSILCTVKFCYPLILLAAPQFWEEQLRVNYGGRRRLKCDGTRAETRFRLSAQRTSPFKSAGASVQSTTGSRGVRISGGNARYTMFRGSVKGTGYPLHSPVSPSLPLPRVTVCHHIQLDSTITTHRVALRTQQKTGPILRSTLEL
jgi:hypothetical protein